MTHSEKIPTTYIPARHRKEHDPKDFGSGETGEHQPWAGSPSLPEK